MQKRFGRAALVAALGGCGSTGGLADDPGPLIDVANVTSQTGAYHIAMLAHAAAPTRGNQTLVLVVTSDDGPADGLTLTLVPWMPAMGHGTSITPTVTPLGSGGYELDDVDLFMAGLWELRTTFAAPADYAAPTVEVE